MGFSRAAVLFVALLAALLLITNVHGSGSDEDALDQEALQDDVSLDNDRAVSYKGYKLMSVAPVSKRQRKTVIRLAGKQGVQFWLAQKNATGNFVAQILVAPGSVARVTKRLRDKGVDFRVVIQDLQSAINDEVTSLRDADDVENGHSFHWDKFHRLSAIYAYMHQVARQHPEVAEVKTIGKSSEGRDLLVLKLGRNSQLNKPAMWIDGGIHAREWISPAAVTYVIRELQKDAGLLNKMDFYLMPVLNPDGYEYSHTKDRLWRKTRSLQRAANATKSASKRSRSCYGVDANRNWDSHWGQRSASKDPCSHNYPGPRPFSEPETKAASDFILKLAPAAYLSMHSYSRLWLMPWGHSENPSQHDLLLRKVSLKAVEAIQDVGGHTYKTGSIHNVLYPISGSSMDWAHEKAGVRFAFLAELGDAGDYGFVLPPSEIELTGKEMFAAVREVAKAAIEDPKDK
ncbi:carboxypeptidase B-like [Neocloeon triangulifer]|uniref:carboxypeptidase B-like n=1 Tax=Neocloeon triangulifer TaxID=2078957 RepID=UPI00286F4946|nr:carboxypeptidase B-like [Neocloeon triangulifer]